MQLRLKQPKVSFSTLMPVTAMGQILERMIRVFVWLSILCSDVHFRPWLDPELCEASFSKLVSLASVPKHTFQGLGTRPPAESSITARGATDSSIPALPNLRNTQNIFIAKPLSLEGSKIMQASDQLLQCLRAGGVWARAGPAY